MERNDTTIRGKTIRQKSEVGSGVGIVGNVGGSVTGMIINETHFHNGKKDSVHERYYRKLKDGLKRRYILDDSWVTPLPWKAKSSMRTKDYFTDLKFQRLHGTKHLVLKNEKVSLKESLKLSNVHVFIGGESGFGKTCLCCKLAYDWAKGDPHESDLKVDNTFLILYRLRDLAESHCLEESLVNFVHSVLPEEDLVKTRKALQTTKDKIILILDGYDELKDQQKEEVKKLLATNKSADDLFTNPLIIITSRDITNQEFLSCFEEHLLIAGLSKKNIKHFIRKYFVGIQKEKKKACKSFIRGLCEAHESVISPFLLYMICYLFEEGIIPVNKDELILERLVPKIIYMLAMRCNERGKYGMSEDKVKEKVNLLTELLFQCHRAKYYRLSRTYLQQQLGDSFEFVTDCGILKALSHNERIYEPVHRIFLEYHPIPVVRQDPTTEDETDTEDGTRVLGIQSRFCDDVYFVRKIFDMDNDPYITMMEVQRIRRKSLFQKITDTVGKATSRSVFGLTGGEDILKEPQLTPLTFRAQSVTEVQSTEPRLKTENYGSMRSIVNNHGSVRSMVNNHGSTRSMVNQAFEKDEDENYGEMKNNENGYTSIPKNEDFEAKRHKKLNPCCNIA